MKRRLAVIMMADMVDYSRLMEADQSGTIGLIGELRERWLEPEVERRGGEVLKRMGDGWIIAFNSTSDAVETAQVVQTTLAGHDRIKLRIAAHLGEIAEDGTDLGGVFAMMHHAIPWQRKNEKNLESMFLVESAE